jgi:hypothetical protein
LVEEASSMPLGPRYFAVESDADIWIGSSKVVIKEAEKEGERGKAGDVTKELTSTKGLKKKD